MVSSSRGLVVEPMASAIVEGGPGSATVTEPLRTDELLSEPASDDLTKTGASPVIVGVSAIEPIEVSTAVKGALKDIAEETIKSGAMTTVTSTTSGNAILTYKQPLLFLVTFGLTKYSCRYFTSARINFEGADGPLWRG